MRHLDKSLILTAAVGDSIMVVMPWWVWVLVLVGVAAWIAPGARVAFDWHKAKGIGLVWLVSLLLFTPIAYFLGWASDGLRALGLMEPPDERYARLEAELQRIGIAPTLDGVDDRHLTALPEARVKFHARDYSSFDGWQERLGWEGEVDDALARVSTLDASADDLAFWDSLGVSPRGGPLADELRRAGVSSAQAKERGLREWVEATVDYSGAVEKNGVSLADAGPDSGRAADSDYFAWFGSLSDGLFHLRGLPDNCGTTAFWQALPGARHARPS